jgi:UDP-N-acetylmuramate dehydrogenase
VAARSHAPALLDTLLRAHFGSLAATPLTEQRDIPFSELTTLRLGGAAERLIEASTEEEVVEAASAGDDSPFIMSGGSNLVVADEGVEGTVIRVASRGISLSSDRDEVRAEVAAGEPWDGLVARCVNEQLTGLECLSGIPGSTGATPIQNVGAYGQEVSSTISAVRAYDRKRRQVVELSPADCGFAYRTSAFKSSNRHVVLAVTFVLERAKAARPVQYSELARTLDVEVGSRPPLSEVREAVLGLRRRKGMVIDPEDPDSVSAGSFFVNPILSAEQFSELKRRVLERLGAQTKPPQWPEREGRVKTSAAWLIERAGFHRGYGDGRVRVSCKHTLAIVNRGGGTTSELLSLARELRDGVSEQFGVTLRPEPTLVGVKL